MTAHQARPGAWTRDRQGRMKRRWLRGCAVDGYAGDLRAWGQAPDLVADLACDIDGDHEVADLDIADVKLPAEPWRMPEAEYLANS
jgi:hypothetical protein